MANGRVFAALRFDLIEKISFAFLASSKGNFNACNASLSIPSISSLWIVNVVVRKTVENGVLSIFLTDDRKSAVDDKQTLKLSLKLSL